MTITDDFVQLNIEVDEDGYTIHIELLQVAEGFVYTEEWLHQKLEEAGFLGLAVAQPTHEKLAELINSQHLGRVMLGKAVDAKIDVIVSSDMLTANLRIVAAKGGAEADTGNVLEALNVVELDLALVNKKRIIGLIMKSRVASPGEVVEVVIAKGKSAEHGKDTQFECLLGDIAIRKPSEREDGSIDYCDLGEILCVDEGTQLMRKLPPTPSKNGLSVTGHELPARIGKVLNFKKCKGTTCSPTDQDLLIAAIKGQPSMDSKGINVDNLYTVQTVNVHTGHIDYDGSLLVKGDISSGMKIKVSGDVQVFGMVENACIEAGGNIDIKLGAIGRAETMDTEECMKIDCKGNLSAGYLESVVANVEGDVLIKSRLSNCNLSSKHQVIVGNRQQDKSGVMGGYIRAGSIIRAEVLGSSGFTPTQVEISCCPSVIETFNGLDQEIVANNELLVRMLGMLVGLSKKKSDVAKDLLEKTKKETEEIKAITNRLIVQKETMEADIEKKRSGKIIAQKEAHPGVTIRFLDQEQLIKSRYGEGSFILFEGAISHNASVK